MDFRPVISRKKLPRVYGSNITVLSPAKINLYLNILGKYPRGFHRIESVIERISIFDKLTLALTEKPGIEIFSNVKELESSDNLCVRAAALMQKKYSIPYGINILLEKNIPMGAGLGGGSSNAASTLLALNNILGLNLEQEDLYSLGQSLGSDVNFFLAQSRFALVEGRGEKVRPWQSKHVFHHCLIWPGIFLSTKKIYAGTRVKLTKFFNNVNIIRYAIKRKDDFLLNKSIFNVLEQSAQELSRELRSVKSYLDASGFSFAMTGSGSAFYSLSSSCYSSRRGGMENFKNNLPKEWTVVYAQTC